ncbi:MAG TPA: lipid II flippase MurJ [Candidatus Binatia bacterium]|nr:lipid II flippase MurJ [Candidatus Binatia bacterium]
MSATDAAPMRTGSATLLTLASQIVQLGAGTITAVLVARLFGPSGKGVVSLVMLSTSLGITFGGLGVSMYNGCVAGRGDHTRGALRANSLTCAVLGTAGVTVVVLSLWLGGALSASAGQILWTLAVIPMGLLWRNLAGIFQGQGRFVEFNVLPLVLWAVASVTTAVLGLTLGGVNTALAAWWLAHAATATAAWMMTRDPRRMIGSQRTIPLIDLALLRTALEFGLAVWCVQLIGESNLRFDTYVAALAGGAAGAGYYSVAASIAALLFHVPVAIGVGVLPRLATATREEAARLAGAGCRISLWSSAALSLVVALLARPLVHLLFGSGFDPAVAPLVTLLPGMAAYALAHVTTSYFYAQLGRPMLNGVVALVSLVIGLVASAVLAPPFGLVGVAAAVSLGRVVAIIVNVWLFTRLSGCPLIDVLLPRPSDLSLMLQPLQRLWPNAKPA